MLKYLLTISKEYLAQGLLKCVKFKQGHISKIKTLRKENKVLKNENDLQKSYGNLHTQINSHENEKTILQNKYDDSRKSLLKFLRVKRIWINKLNFNMCPLTKKVLDSNQMIRKNHANTSLLKRPHKENSKVGLVPETIILATTTEVIVFIFGTITTLVRCAQVFMALTKATTRLSSEGLVLIKITLNSKPNQRLKQLPSQRPEQKPNRGPC